VELAREPDAPKRLSDNPLAASRLIARMVGRGLIRGAAQVGAVQALDLSPTKLGTLPLKVPIGRCLDINAGIGPGASGVELRVVGADGQELSLVRGSVSGTTRVCTLRAGQTLHANLELRVLSGSGGALVAMRLIDPR
jgi:hypothetical protein